MILQLFLLIKNYQNGNLLVLPLNVLCLFVLVFDLRFLFDEAPRVCDGHVSALFVFYMVVN